MFAEHGGHPCAGLRTDLLLLSCGFTPTYRGLPAHAATAVREALTQLPLLQARVFLSRPASWRKAPPGSAHRRFIEAVDGLIGPEGASHLPDAAAAEPTGDTVAPWVSELRASLCALPLADARESALVCFTFRGSRLDAIAYRGTLVVCHARLGAAPKVEVSGGGKRAADLIGSYGLMSQLLLRHGWRSVCKLFTRHHPPPPTP